MPRRAGVMLLYLLIALVAADAPVISPASVTIPEFQQVVLTVANLTNAPQGYYTFQWQLNGANITSLSTARSRTLVISAIAISQAGSYTVLATGGGKTTRSAPVAVTVLYRPVVVANPRPVTFLSVGESYQLIVAGLAYPAADVAWFKNGLPLPNATSTILLIPAVTLADAGTYTARFSNSMGDSTTADAVLNINTPPQITEQPSNTTVLPDAAVTLSVVAVCTPFPQFQWYHNDTPIADQTQSVLSISGASPSNEGWYRAAVSNVAGTIVSQSVYVTVYTVPVITRDLPLTVTLNPNDELELTVTATANPAPAYIWMVRCILTIASDIL